MLRNKVVNTTEGVSNVYLSLTQTRHLSLTVYMPCVSTLVSACDLPLEPKARHGSLTKHKLLCAALSMAVLGTTENTAFFKKKKKKVTTSTGK